MRVASSVESLSCEQFWVHSRRLDNILGNDRLQYRSTASIDQIRETTTSTPSTLMMRVFWGFRKKAKG